jgi:HAD superfamily 5'-nucleotidase-like hydrolase
MPVYVNRVLNLKKIKVIGFDMDYTLVRYNPKAFEELTYEKAKEKLITIMSYPKEVGELNFDYDRSIVGLVVDKRNGNLLKLSLYGKVKKSFHGLDEIDYKTQNKIYQNMLIDISRPEFQSLDTSFAISNGVLFQQLVQLKKEGVNLPDYYQIAEDIKEAIDISHQDDSIKSVVVKNFNKYVIKDSKVAFLLEKYKAHGKKLMIITNSDYNYSKALLDYALNPFWKKHNRWEDVIDLTITLAVKPRFFERSGNFLKIEPDSGLMSNYRGLVDKGFFQGGWFQKVQDDFGVEGSEILYLGDHIYGDVVSIKKRCSWRTALVLGDLEGELIGIEESKGIQENVDKLMRQKTDLEMKINRMDIQKDEGGPVDRKKMDVLFTEIDKINKEISDGLVKYNQYFNPYWGQILRAGYEESRFADQVEKYACIYMTKVSDLYDYSPKTYFRPMKRYLPHEI